MASVVAKDEEDVEQHTKSDEAEDAKPAEVPTNARRSTRWIVIVTVAVAVIAGLGWLVHNDNSDTQIHLTPPMMGVFKHKKTGDLVADWRIWVSEAKSFVPKYPRNRFSGRGIVSSAGGPALLTQAYLLIALLRNHHKCTLPIEIYYIGKKEAPGAFLKYMHSTFRDVRFIDIYDVIDVPKGVPMRGLQIKVFALILSSFEEAMWIDVDSYPVADPSFLFDSKAYRRTGALFWPDPCNQRSAKYDAWEVFGLKPPPPHYPKIPIDRNFATALVCDETLPIELETGESVIHKRRVWKALMLMFFVHSNPDTFFPRFFWGDKSPDFPFNSTGTTYSLAPDVYFVGRYKNQKFCGNSFGQRNPATGQVLFVHRGLAKIADAGEFMSFGDTQEVWTHVLKRSRYVPASYFPLPVNADPSLEVPFMSMCVALPYNDAHEIVPAPDDIARTDRYLIKAVREFTQLPFYPRNRHDCAAPVKAFFCNNNDRLSMSYKIGKHEF